LSALAVCATPKKAFTVFEMAGTWAAIMSRSEKAAQTTNENKSIHKLSVGRAEIVSANGLGSLTLLDILFAGKPELGQRVAQIN
jgi:hypothetical protein